jgi:hypothetical protein
LLQFLADHSNLEQNSARGDAPLHFVELRGRHFAGTVRDVEQDSLELIEHAGQRGVALFQRGLAIQSVFFDEILGAASLGGDVDFFLLAVFRLGVAELDEHHFGAAEVFADGHDENALANL